jgi:hypothetical protein
MAIDTDKSFGITYEELVVSFRDVHTNYILFKVRNAITMGKLTPGKVFRVTDADDSNSLDVVEFNDMIKTCF